MEVHACVVQSFPAAAKNALRHLGAGAVRSVSNVSTERSFVRSNRRTRREYLDDNSSIDSRALTRVAVRLRVPA